MPKDKNQLIKEYRNYLDEDEKAIKTTISYTGDMLAFLTWLESKNIAIEEVLQRFYVTTYKKHLLENNYL